MEELKLFMVLLGCKPRGRNTEQHDIFFGIGKSMKDLKEQILAFWPEAGEKIHIDAWREVSFVDGYKVEVRPRSGQATTQTHRLFFINLGGYKKEEFEEFHYKILIAAADKGEAVQKAKQTAFFKHVGFEGATSHIDDKYGIDVDDAYDIEEVLPDELRKNYAIYLEQSDSPVKDEQVLGYLKLSKIQ